MKGMNKKPINSSGYHKQEKASMHMGATTAKGMSAKGNMSYAPKLSKL